MVSVVDTITNAEGSKLFLTARKPLRITFSLVNTSASTATVNIYVKQGSTSYRITPKDLSLPAGAMLKEDEEILMSGQSLYLSSTQNGDVRVKSLDDNS